MFSFPLDWMLSEQTACGQVSSPTHPYIPLDVMDGDVPSSRISDVQRFRAEKNHKDDTVYTVKGLLSEDYAPRLLKDRVEKATLQYFW